MLFGAVTEGYCYSMNFMGVTVRICCELKGRLPSSFFVTDVHSLAQKAAGVMAALEGVHAKMEESVVIPMETAIVLLAIMDHCTFSLRKMENCCSHFVT